MPPDDETLHALREAAPDLLVEFGLVALYLTGSRGRGAHSPDSDVDVAVLPVGAVHDVLTLTSELGTRLERRLDRSVDVVVLDVERLGLPLLGSLLRDAVLVASADEPARVAFEVRALALVFDFELHAAPLRAQRLAEIAAGKS